MILCPRPIFSDEFMMEKPSSMDICCGRGKGKWNSPGNRRFKELVLQYLDQYEAAPSKAEKSKVVEMVVKVVQDQGGRFIKEDAKGGTWTEIKPADRRAKVAHCIRDHLSSTKKGSSGSSVDKTVSSMSHSKQARRNLQASKNKDVNVGPPSALTNAGAADFGLFGGNVLDNDLMSGALGGGHSNMMSFQNQGHGSLAALNGHDNFFPPQQLGHQPQGNTFAQLLAQAEADTQAMKSSIMLQASGASSYLWPSQVLNQQNVNGPAGGLSTPFLPLYASQLHGSSLDPMCSARMFQEQAAGYGNQLNSCINTGYSNEEAVSGSLSSNHGRHEPDQQTSGAGGDPQQRFAGNFHSFNGPAHHDDEAGALSRASLPGVTTEHHLAAPAPGGVKPSWDFMDDTFGAGGHGGNDVQGIEPNTLFPSHGE